MTDAETNLSYENPHLAKCCLVSLASTVTLSLAILSSGLIEVQAQPNKTAPVKHSQTLKPRERIIERRETPRPEQPAEQSLSFALPPHRTISGHLDSGVLKEVRVEDARQGKISM
jgi:hypothetical protein